MSKKDYYPKVEDTLKKFGIWKWAKKFYKSRLDKREYKEVNAVIANIEKVAGSGGADIIIPNGGISYALPIDKVYITQKFGERPEVYKQFGMKGHNGLDFRTRFIDSPLGKRYIVAIADGYVMEVENEGNRGYGIYVRLRHEGTEQSVYGHFKKWYVKKGQFVRMGQRIGLSDNTGFSSGPHLHLGYRPDKFNYSNGYKGYVDPLKTIYKNLNL